jgi:hypothetical protein
VLRNNTDERDEKCVQKFGLRTGREEILLDDDTIKMNLKKG